MAPQNWMIDWLKMYKTPANPPQKKKGNHEKLESRIDNRKKSLPEVIIQRDIFQRDTLSPLLSVIVIMPLNHILRKSVASNKFVNHKKWLTTQWS